MCKNTFRGKIWTTGLLQILGMFLVLCGGAFAQERTWVTFSPPSGDWSILAPGILQPDEEALESPSTAGSYSYNDFTGFFAVVYRDTPKRNILWKPFKKSHFKRVRKDFVKSANGELIKEEKFSIGDEPGREVYIKMPNGRVMGRESQVKTTYRVQRIRMFFHNRRFYMLLAVLPEEQINAPEINDFFSSFVVK